MFQTKVGYVVAQLVEALRYKSESRGFDSRWFCWNFSLTKSGSHDLLEPSGPLQACNEIVLHLPFYLQTKAIEKIKTRFLKIFFFKSCRLCDNVEKYCRAGQATNDSMVHANGVLDNYGNTQTQNM